MTYVFDIDGTLANCSHRLHWINSKPKNWNAFFASIKFDTPIEPIISLFHSIVSIPNSTVVLASGRNEDCREQTINWLSTHVKEDFNFPLYMRKSKDYRPDDIIKVELLNEIRKNHGEPKLWFDDRPRVIRALRNEGVFVVDVYQSEEDF